MCNLSDDDIITATCPTASRIEGEVKDWFLAPNGDHIGMILGDDGGVYIAGSKNCTDGVAGIAKGSRVRFRPEYSGSSVDMLTKQTYNTGVARDIVI